MKWGLTETIGGIVAVTIHWTVLKLLKYWKFTLGFLFILFVINTTINTFKNLTRNDQVVEIKSQKAEVRKELHIEKKEHSANLASTTDTPERSKEQADDNSKMARCVISEPHGEEYKGPCVFTIEDDAGSFSVSVPEYSANRYFIYPMSSITVWIKSKGIGEAFATTDALNVRMGEVYRSRSDRACWGHVDGPMICAY